MIRLLAVAAVVVLLMASASALRIPGLSNDPPTSEPPSAVPSPISAIGSSRPSSPGIPTTTPEVVAPPTPVPDLAKHVELAGDDAGDGSADRPWRTLAHALKTASDGTEIRLGPGEFKGGTASRPGVTIAGVPGQTTVSGGLHIDADDVTVTGLIITGVTKAYSGALVVQDASGTVIVDNEVTGNTFGIHLVDALGVQIERNTITDNGYGLEIHGRTDGTTIVDNEIVDNDRRIDKSRGAGGINLFFTEGGITIEDNVIRDNDDVAIEIYGASDLDIRGNRMSGSNDLIETGTQDGRPCANMSITRNLLFAEKVGGEDEERGIYLRCATDTVVAWNTFDGLDRFAIGLFRGKGDFNGPLERLAISHNIFSGGRAFSLDSKLPPDVTIDDDVFFPCRVTTCPVLGREFAFVSGQAGTERLATFREWTGFEPNGIFADPMFVDAEAHDYRLRPGSPATDFAGAYDAPAN